MIYIYIHTPGLCPMGPLSMTSIFVKPTSKPSLRSLVRIRADRDASLSWNSPWYVGRFVEMAPLSHCSVGKQTYCISTSSQTPHVIMVYLPTFAINNKSHTGMWMIYRDIPYMDDSHILKFTD